MPAPTSEQIEQFKKDHPEDLQTHDIPGMEVFSAGTWNGDAYTIADLDEMVRAHAEIGGQLKPYMKLGHAPGQALLKSDELPAAGWLHNIRREGDRLVADVKNVPSRIYKLLKAKAYMRRSAEVLCNVKVGGKAYKYALKACAFLGGEMPAVSTLDDVLALYATVGPAKAYESDAEVRAYDINLKETPMSALDPKDQRIADLVKENDELRNGKLKEFTAENAALKTQVKEQGEKLSAETARAEAAEAKVSEFAEKAETAEITAVVDGLIAKRKIAPAQKEAVFAMLKGAKSAAEKKYTVGGKSKGLDEIVKEFFANAPDLDVNVDGGESETGADQKVDLASRAREYSAKNKVSYEDALIKLSSEDEKAAKAKAAA